MNINPGKVSVQTESGNPVFAVQLFANIRQSVDVQDVPGFYAVILARSASETVGTTWGAGVVTTSCYTAEDPDVSSRSMWLQFIPAAIHEWKL